MAKSNSLLKRTTNALLDLLAQHDAAPTSESALARRLNVSRTTIHAAVRQLDQQGLLARQGRNIGLAHPPADGDYFAGRQTMRPQEVIEQVLMDRMRQGLWQDGCEFSESDLARLSGVSTASVREFLIGFSRFHLIERRPRGGWRLLGLSVAFADEVAEMRQMIELAAMQRLTMAAAHDRQCREAAERFLERHRALLPGMSHGYKDFRALDREFHLWLIGHLENRFAEDFFDIVSFVFYYHYQWNADVEMQHNIWALQEHIVILENLLKPDLPAAIRDHGRHLATSRAALIGSLRW